MPVSVDLQRFLLHRFLPSENQHKYSPNFWHQKNACHHKTRQYATVPCQHETLRSPAALRPHPTQRNTLHVAAPPQHHAMPRETLPARNPASRCIACASLHRSSPRQHATTRYCTLPSQNLALPNHTLRHQNTAVLSRTPHRHYPAVHNATLLCLHLTSQHVLSLRSI